ncbi:uncharacterized protein LOC132519913 isoform X2 [Lagenorhynchus albirostris]|uniref:uncharacterized protein LOC132519913 isoform X2 n=1 Tax=Lagenorhynchus albirostris TaxID=27610 RepID=UPI0028E6D1A4|nr:uncharacterized protein LOC132519913 isoform X2 [Lagenorhynchus albirostris]
MGANRPLASRRSVAVLTVHGTLSAADSEPAPRPRRVITATRRGSRAPVPALSDGAGTGLSGRRWSREAAGSEPAASPPANPARLCCYSSCVQFTFQPLTPDPASAPAAPANMMFPTSRSVSGSRISILVKAWSAVASGTPRAPREPRWCSEKP